MRIRNILLTFAALFCAASLATAATIPHTWVSMTGNDNNPCTYTSPCATFQYALAKTSANGTISVEGPGDYNQPNSMLVIEQSITIDGMGMTSISGYLFIESGNPNAPTTPLNITLRGLTLNGMGQGEGINAAFTGNVTIDNCLIENFTQSAVTNNGTNLVIKNSTILNSPIGLYNQTGNASLQNVTIQGSTTQAVFSEEGTVEISNSVLTQNSVGVMTSANNGTLISLENSMLTLNGTAVCGSVRLMNSDILDNQTGIGNCNGNVQTNGNNRNTGNTYGNPIQSAPSKISTITLF